MDGLFSSRGMRQSWSIEMSSEEYHAGSVVYNSPSHVSLLTGVRLGLQCNLEFPHRGCICVFAVGPCSVAGDLMSDLADDLLDFPVINVSDVRVPGWVGKGTLSIVLSSADDNVELSQVIKALRNVGSDVVCIAPNDFMAHTSEADMVIPMPDNADSLSQVGFCIGALTSVLSEVTDNDFRDPLFEALETAEKFLGSMSKSSLDMIARGLSGKVNAFYSTSDIHACSKWWKQMFDLASNDLSFFGELPEFDHNELVGWSDPNIHAPELNMVVLKGTSESVLVDDIVHCMVEVLCENGRKVEVVNLGGKNPLESNIRGMVLGCMISDFVRGRI